MLRLSARLGLFMTMLFSTVTALLSRSDDAPLDSRWQVAFIAHVVQVGLSGRIMNADGTDVQNLSLDGQPVYYFDCSPDGGSLVFAAGDSVYVASADDQMRLVNTHGISAGEMSVSNRGEVIYNDVFHGTDKVYLVSASASHQPAPISQLPTDGFGYGRMYDLSPEGSRVAYYTPGEANLYIASRTGDTLARLPGVAFAADWSPAGTMVAFSADWDGNFEIYVLDVAHHITMQLTHQRRGYGNTFPAWSPDGRHIVFVHTEASGLGSSYGGDLHVINVDGSAQRLLARFSDEVVTACVLDARPALLTEGQS